MVIKAQRNNFFLQELRKLAKCLHEFTGY